MGSGSEGFRVFVVAVSGPIVKGTFPLVLNRLTEP